MSLISYLFLPSFFLMEQLANPRSELWPPLLLRVTQSSELPLGFTLPSRHGHHLPTHVVGHHNRHRLQSLCTSTHDKRLSATSLRTCSVVGATNSLRSLVYHHCYIALLDDPTRLCQLLGKRKQKKHAISKGIRDDLIHDIFGDKCV